MKMVFTILFTVSLLTLGSCFVSESTPVSISDPPVSGEWIVDDVQTLTDTTILLNGSIFITDNGSLTVTNSDIIIQGNAEGASNGDLNITVDGGTLVIDDSTITTDDPSYLTYIFADNEATVELSGSSFENCGYSSTAAIKIKDSNNVEITGCTVTGPAAQPLRAGIFFDNVSNGAVSNNIITTDNPSASFLVGNGIEVRDSNATVITGNNMTCLDYGRPYLFVHSPYSDVRDNIGWNDNTYWSFFFYGGCSYSIVINNQITSEQSDGIVLASHESRDSYYVMIEDNVITTLGSVAIRAGSNNTYLSIKNNTLYSVDNNGITIYGSDSVSITGNTITSAINGIYLENSNDSIISSNRIENTTDDGIHIENSNNCTINNNELSDINTALATVEGIYIVDSSNLTVSGNNIDFTGGDGIQASNTNDTLFSDNVISSAGSDGIYNFNCFGNTIDGNAITGCNYNGIYSYDSHDVIVSDNTVHSNYGDGIRIYPTGDRPIITGNSIVDNNHGIYLTTLSNNGTITENYVANNHYGVLCWGSDHIFYNNSFLFNFYGVKVESSAAGNLFYYNDFIDNFVQASDFSFFGNNEWSRHVVAPESFIGNFWSDYDGVDVVAPTGVGDTPYNLTGAANVADFYPLMDPITVLPPPTVTSPADITVLANTTGSVIVWEVSTPVSSDTLTISVDGTEVYSGVWNSAVITYTLDVLAKGNETSYTVTLTVYDTLGQSTSDTVTVYIEKAAGSSAGGLPIDPISAGAGLVAGLAVFGAGSFIIGRRK